MQYAVKQGGPPPKPRAPGSRPCTQQQSAQRRRRDGSAGTARLSNEDSPARYGLDS